MLVFHGSPSYFGKFSSRTIGSARWANFIQGIYFTKKLHEAYNYSQKYLSGTLQDIAFIDHPKNNSTGYIYVCEIPDESKLFDATKRLCEQSDEVQQIVYRLINGNLGGYFKLNMQTAGVLFLLAVKRYFSQCLKILDDKEVTRFLSEAGLKGVIIQPSERAGKEIVIFNANDITIYQCFVVDMLTLEPEFDELGEVKPHLDDKVHVLFKRFGEYYTATGLVFDPENKIACFSTGYCPEILDEVQGLKDLEKIPHVIAYNLIGRQAIHVTERNMQSLVLRPVQKPYTGYNAERVEKEITGAQSVYYNKVIDTDKFNEYQNYIKQAKTYKQKVPIMVNTGNDILQQLEVNALFLQRAEKPYFDIKHKQIMSAEEADEQVFAIHYGITKQQLEHQREQERQRDERKLSDVEIEEAVNHLKAQLMPKLTERFNTIFGSEVEQEQAHTAVQ